MNCTSALFLACLLAVFLIFAKLDQLPPWLDMTLKMLADIGTGLALLMLVPVALALSPDVPRVYLATARVSDEDVRAGIVQSAKGHVLLGCAEGSLELLSVKRNTEALRETSAAIGALRAKTDALREELSRSFMASCHLQGADYLSISDDEKLALGSLVNNAKSLGSLIVERVSTRDGE